MSAHAGIFEVLASDDSDSRLASRKALVLARTRIDQRLGTFLVAAQSRDEFDSRYALVGADFASIVRVAADEVGHEDANGLIKSLHAHYRHAGKPPWLENDDDDESDEKHEHKDDDEDDHKAPPFGKKDDDDDKKESSVHEARMPKMCPYHHEIVDIGLATGDPQAGYSAMASHAWGDNHCQGAWEGGKCKFKREMVTQSYWDDRQKQLDERRQERADQGQENVIDLPQDEPGDYEETPVLETEPEAEIIEFPSGDEIGESVVEPVADAVPLAVAASTKQSDAGNTDLGGPSPKMDKKRWTPESVKPIDVPSTKHPTKQKDPTEVQIKKNQGPPGDASAIKEVGEQTTTQETLPSESENSGFQGGGEDFGPATKTFPKGPQTSPVTQPTLEKAARWSATRVVAEMPQGKEICPRCKGQGCNDCQGTGSVASQAPPDNMRTEWDPGQVAIPGR
jgi:hypothetical protein